MKRDRGRGDDLGTIGFGRRCLLQAPRCLSPHSSRSSHAFLLLRVVIICGTALIMVWSWHCASDRLVAVAGFHLAADHL